MTGARPGDVVEVELHRVDPTPAAGEAWTGIFGGFGALQHEGLQPLADLCAEVRIHAFRAAASRAMGAPIGLACQAN